MKQVFSFVLAFTTLFGSTAQAQNLVPSRMPFGHLDKADKDTIGLWALDLDRPSSPVNVFVFDESTNTAYLYSTFHIRPDVNAAFGVTGNHGLTVQTPPLACPDSRVRRFYAYALDEEGTGNTPEIGGSPKSYLCWDNPTAPDVTAVVLGNGFWPLDSARTAGLNVQLYKKNENGTYYWYRGSNWNGGDGLVIDGALKFWGLEAGEYRLQVGADDHDVARIDFVYDGFTQRTLGGVVLKLKGTNLTVVDGPSVWQSQLLMGVNVTSNYAHAMEARLVAQGPSVTEAYDLGVIATIMVPGAANGRTDRIDFMVDLPAKLPKGFEMNLFVEIRPEGQPFVLLARRAVGSVVIR